MDIIVCIKRVPETAEAEIKVDASGKDIIKERLTFDLNESDSYALEEAILLKEKFGGTVTLVSIGPQECDDILRMGLARGADTAIRVTDEKFEELDGFATAGILESVIKDLHFDVIFTGCMASDDGYSQVGPMLAELLGIPHATLVTNIQIKDGIAKVQRELEGGLLEILEIRLPALFTIQTGINEPRYASLLAIRRAAAKEIKVLGAEDLGIEELTLTTRIDSLFPPPVGERAEIIEGTPDEVSSGLAGIFKEKGLL